MRHNPDSKVRFIATSICDCKLLNRVAEKKKILLITVVPALLQQKTQQTAVRSRSIYHRKY